ncbi:Insulin-degrading enzyme-like 2 [Camellia lanceoleosa]|uniref:Insulin-degrading enzyme-like 2 n=1 Tax=Camellia lanceoleosa TaxID=1840588 RepID=A0ACC0GID8_9ERIC|nr:Insulin-degrading enzyme-like 2 [Camellia lanceoleosa]
MSIFATIDKLYPPNDWLVGSSLPSKFSPTIIESTLNELTPNNVRKQSARTQLIQRKFHRSMYQNFWHI